MKITISVPYHHPEQVPIWAHQEREIDFRKDREKADRCTLAFAALELRDHLLQTLLTPDIRFSSHSVSGQSGRPETDLEIRLETESGEWSEGSYRLEPAAGKLSIVGHDRVGVLYGVYHLLELQGWRWLAPGVDNEIRPEPAVRLTLPNGDESHAPGFDLCRGVDFAPKSKESVELLLWMARNRQNLAGYRPTTGNLGRKLGMIYKNGGHIFEPILDPDRVLEDGRTVWEAHRAWYGIPAKGELTKTDALRTQFCVSQPDLLDFLADELVYKVETEWSEADLVSVWGFDTWGSCCTCASCRALGNDSDQYVFLLSRLRRGLDAALASGRLDHPVRMSGCAYEGTSTLPGPGKAIPQNLIDAGDCVIFYPIDRSYAADLYDPNSRTNVPYATALDSWLDRPDALPVIVGEYFNVSKYADLPILFTRRIEADLKAYRDRGVSGMTYMHSPMVAWAVRTLTQYHYARANWNPDTKAAPLVDQYLADRYGPHAEAMAEVYRLVEAGFLRVGEWRNWHSSVLDFLMYWDGSIPEAPMQMANDLADAKGALLDGEASIVSLNRALEITENLVRRENERDAQNPDLSLKVAVNPTDYTGMMKGSPYALPLGEARRLIRYGLDTMKLMTEVVRYHDALARDDRATAEAAWLKAETIGDQMDTYWVPIDYDYPGPGLRCRDAFTRTQLRDVMARCRRFRTSCG